MEKKAYDDLIHIEDSWWGKGRSMAVSRVLSRFLKLSEGKVLDVGAGYGSMFSVLSLYGSVSAFEIYTPATDILHKRGYKEVFINAGDVERLTGEFNLVGAFDVIEHIKDDEKFSELLFNLIKPGGVLIATVPAYQFMWSRHDIENRHFRRYSKKQICILLSKAGFKVKYVSYWNFSLFTVALLLRFLKKGGGESLHPHLLLSMLLTTLMWLESRLIPFTSFPWRTGIVIFAERK